MKFKIGDVVYHKLTGDKFLVIGYSMGNVYHCRSENYTEHLFAEEEIEKK